MPRSPDLTVSPNESPRVHDDRLPAEYVPKLKQKAMMTNPSATRQQVNNYAQSMASAIMRNSTAQMNARLRGNAQRGLPVRTAGAPGIILGQNCLQNPRPVPGTGFAAGGPILFQVPPRSSRSGTGSYSPPRITAIPARGPFAPNRLPGSSSSMSPIRTGPLAGHPGLDRSLDIGAAGMGGPPAPLRPPTISFGPAPPREVATPAVMRLPPRTNSPHGRPQLPLGLSTTEHDNF